MLLKQLTPFGHLLETNKKFSSNCRTCSIDTLKHKISWDTLYRVGPHISWFRKQ